MKRDESFFQQVAFSCCVVGICVMLNLSVAGEADHLGLLRAYTLVSADSR